LASDIYLYVVSLKKFHVATTLKLIDIERRTGGVELYELYLENELEIPMFIRRVLECEFYTRRLIKTIDWDEMFYLIQKDSAILLVSKAISAAEVANNKDFLNSLFQFFDSTLKETDSYRHFIFLSLAYIEIGDQKGFDCICNSYARVRKYWLTKGIVDVKKIKRQNTKLEEKYSPREPKKEGGSNIDLYRSVVKVETKPQEKPRLLFFRPLKAVSQFAYNLYNYFKVIPEDVCDSIAEARMYKVVSNVVNVKLVEVKMGTLVKNPVIDLKNEISSKAHLPVLKRKMNHKLIRNTQSQLQRLCNITTQFASNLSKCFNVSFYSSSAGEKRHWTKKNNIDSTAALKSSAPTRQLKRKFKDRFRVYTHGLRLKQKFLVAPKDLLFLQLSKFLKIMNQFASNLNEFFTVSNAVIGALSTPKNVFSNYILHKFSRNAVRNGHIDRAKYTVNLLNKKGETFLANQLFFKLYSNTRFKEVSWAIKIVANEEKDQTVMYYDKLIHAVKGSEVNRLIIECRYAFFLDADQGLLARVKVFLQEDFNPVLINLGIQVAILERDSNFLLEADSLLRGYYLNNITPVSNGRRLMTILASAYYKLGDKASLSKLVSNCDYQNPEFLLYEYFSQNNIPKVLEARSEGLKAAFSRSFIKTVNDNNNPKIVLAPEKDLCGEAFNSLFYLDVLEDIGSFSVVCDARLHSVLLRSFPGVNFIPKKPRYLVEAERKSFDLLPEGLELYLDNSSYKMIRSAYVMPIPYAKYCESENFYTQREAGWLTLDKRKQNLWKERFFQRDEKTFIGISSNSTLRSKARDLHMVNIEFWEEIFSIDNVCFVNLNANLELSRYCENRFGVEVYNPDFDLYNDFESLLALMSVLDYAIVPANNLMDFAAAVGVKTIVFSPSGIMKFWEKNEKEYFFSSKVKFVFSDEHSSQEGLVNVAVKILEADIEEASGKSVWT